MCTQVLLTTTLYIKLSPLVSKFIGAISELPLNFSPVHAFWQRGPRQPRPSAPSIEWRATDRDENEQQRRGRCFWREAIHVHVREGCHYPARQKIMLLISSLIKSRTLANCQLLFRPCEVDASRWEPLCHGEITSHSN